MSFVSNSALNLATIVSKIRDGTITLNCICGSPANRDCRCRFRRYMIDERGDREGYFKSLAAIKAHDARQAAMNAKKRREELDDDEDDDDDDLEENDKELHSFDSDAKGSFGQSGGRGKSSEYNKGGKGYDPDTGEALNRRVRRNKSRRVRNADTLVPGYIDFATMNVVTDTGEGIDAAPLRSSTYPSAKEEEYNAPMRHLESGLYGNPQGVALGDSAKSLYAMLGMSRDQGFYDPNWTTREGTRGQEGREEDDSDLAEVEAGFAGDMSGWGQSFDRPPPAELPHPDVVSEVGRMADKRQRPERYTTRATNALVNNYRHAVERGVLVPPSNTDIIVSERRAELVGNRKRPRKSETRRLCDQMNSAVASVMVHAS
jgi:hypothetical protein